MPGWTRLMKRDTASAADRRQPWRAGLEVRRDWPDGTHDIVGWHTTTIKAERFARGDREYWRRGPLRPRTWSVVVISRRDARLHGKRHDCRSPDCPAGVAAAGARKDVPR